MLKHTHHTVVFIVQDGGKGAVKMPCDMYHYSRNLALGPFGVLLSGALFASLSTWGLVFRAYNFAIARIVGVGNEALCKRLGRETILVVGSRSSVGGTVRSVTLAVKDDLALEQWTGFLEKVQ